MQTYGPASSEALIYPSLCTTSNTRARLLGLLARLDGLHVNVDGIDGLQVDNLKQGDTRKLLRLVQLTLIHQDKFNQIQDKFEFTTRVF